MDREAWRAAVHGVSKSRTGWVIELNWTEEAKCIPYLDELNDTFYETKIDSKQSSY